MPPQINKFYATDLSPGRSFAEFAVRSGVQTFCISWRNPTAAQRDWNVETYLTACKEAISVAREITGADRVNAMAACAGGFTLATLLGHLAAKGEDVIESATLLVTVLDTEAPTMLGQFASRSGVAATIEKSRRRGVLEGSEMARVFAWLRPNDLVWLFVANNWVMGNRPPAFDILYWNSDTTRLPAEFHADLLRMFMENPLKAPGKISALGTPIDMSKVTGACLRGRGNHRPHHTLAGLLSVEEHTAWQDRLRAFFERPHSKHRESTHQSEGEVFPEFGHARCSRKTGWPARPNMPAAGGTTGHAGIAITAPAKYPRHGRSAAPTHPAGDPAPGRYVHQR